MVELQVTVTEEQAAELERFAAARGVSVDCLLQRGVEEILAARKAQDERVEKFMALAGGFHSGFSDVAENHDKYLFDDDDEPERER